MIQNVFPSLEMIRCSCKDQLRSLHCSYLAAFTSGGLAVYFILLILHALFGHSIRSYCVWLDFNTIWHWVACCAACGWLWLICCPSSLPLHSFSPRSLTSTHSFCFLFNILPPYPAFLTCYSASIYPVKPLPLPSQPAHSQTASISLLSHPRPHLPPISSTSL